MIDDIYTFLLGYLLRSKEESTLYGAEIPLSVDNNLIHMWIEGTDITFDMLNGKVNKVWVQDVPVSLTIQQKYNLTLQLID